MSSPGEHAFDMKRHGEDESFQSGAVRDSRTGKGRFDLISAFAMQRVVSRNSMWQIEPRLMTEEQDRCALGDAMGYLYQWLNYRQEDDLDMAAWRLIESLGGFPKAMRHVAVVYENGAKKYADRNWEKGMPIMRCFDSAARHLTQALGGDQDEDHRGHALWNVMAIMHGLEAVRRKIWDLEMDDRPAYPSPPQTMNINSNSLLGKMGIDQGVGVLNIGDSPAKIVFDGAKAFAKTPREQDGQD